MFRFSASLEQTLLITSCLAEGVSRTYIKGLPADVTAGITTEKLNKTALEIPVTRRRAVSTMNTKSNTLPVFAMRILMLPFRLDRWELVDIGLRYRFPNSMIVRRDVIMAEA